MIDYKKVYKILLKSASEDTQGKVLVTRTETNKFGTTYTHAHWILPEELKDTEKVLAGFSNLPPNHPQQLHSAILSAKFSKVGEVSEELTHLLGKNTVIGKINSKGQRYFKIGNKTYSRKEVSDYLKNKLKVSNNTQSTSGSSEDKKFIYNTKKVIHMDSPLVSSALTKNASATVPLEGELSDADKKMIGDFVLKDKHLEHMARVVGIAPKDEGVIPLIEKLYENKSIQTKKEYMFREANPRIGKSVVDIDDIPKLLNNVLNGKTVDTIMNDVFGEAINSYAVRLDKLDGMEKALTQICTKKWFDYNPNTDSIEVIDSQSAIEHRLSLMKDNPIFGKLAEDFDGIFQQYKKDPNSKELTAQLTQPKYTVILNNLLFVQNTSRAIKNWKTLSRPLIEDFPVLDSTTIAGLSADYLCSVFGDEVSAVSLKILGVIASYHPKSVGAFHTNEITPILKAISKNVKDSGDKALSSDFDKEAFPKEPTEYKGFSTSLETANPEETKTVIKLFESRWKSDKSYPHIKGVYKLSIPAELEKKFNEVVTKNKKYANVTSGGCNCQLDTFFHGTNYNSASDILSEGHLTESTSGMNGSGVYVAKDSNISYKYCKDFYSSEELGGVLLVIESSLGNVYDSSNFLINETDASKKADTISGLGKSSQHSIIDYDEWCVRSKDSVIIRYVVDIE